MSDTLNNARDRVDFSKIRTEIPMPNLIEVQKRSYERFLQMHTAPADRDALVGLQGVFKSIFPIKDFRETCSLEFVEYMIGNWECKCSELQGIEHLRAECEFCGHRLVAPNARGGSVPCQNCGNLTRVTVRECDVCGEAVELKFKYNVEECQERGQTFTVPLKVRSGPAVTGKVFSSEPAAPVTYAFPAASTAIPWPQSQTPPPMYPQ